MRRTVLIVVAALLSSSAIAQSTAVGKVHKFCVEQGGGFVGLSACIAEATKHPDLGTLRSDSTFMLFSDKSAALVEQVKRGTIGEAEAVYQLRAMSVDAEKTGQRSELEASDCRTRLRQWRAAANARIGELSSRPGATMFGAINQADRDTTLAYGPAPICDR
jgi:hypothetical protein